MVDVVDLSSVRCAGFRTSLAQLIRRRAVAFYEQLMHCSICSFRDRLFTDAKRGHRALHSPLTASLSPFFPSQYYVIWIFLIGRWNGLLVSDVTFCGWNIFYVWLMCLTNLIFNYFSKFKLKCSIIFDPAILVSFFCYRVSVFLKSRNLFFLSARACGHVHLADHILVLCWGKDITLVNHDCKDISN